MIVLKQQSYPLMPFFFCKAVYANNQPLQGKGIRAPGWQLPCWKKIILNSKLVVEIVYAGIFLHAGNRALQQEKEGMILLWTGP